MSAAMIRLHASREPQRVAIKHGERYLTYGLADQQMRRLQSALLTARVTERKLVGVAHSDPMVETLLLFALEALCVATLPFVQPADGSIVQALGQCDLVICEQPIDGLAVSYALVTPEWLRAVVSQQVLPELMMRDQVPGNTVNVFTTSGSMGVAKSIVFDAAALNARIASRLRQYRLERDSRLLVAMPPSTSSSYFVVQALLRVGATAVYFDEASADADLAECSHALMLPALLHRLASRGPEYSRPPRRIKILSIGARLSAATRTLASASLNADVMNAYGTTETGWLAMFNDDDGGEVLPGVEVEIVDQHDQLVAYGESGQIRARSPEMGLGYLDEALSKTVFRQGWYYTGDYGRMQHARSLELIGRQDAMMNFGGIKVSPDTIEGALAARGMARDIAVLARADQEGIERLVVVCVAPRLEGAALDQALASALGSNIGSIEVAIVDQLPRNPSGKLLRGEVRAMIERLHAGLP